MNKEDHQLARQLLKTYFIGTQLATVHVAGYVTLEFINLFDTTAPELRLRIETDRLFYGDVETTQDWVVRHATKEEMLHLIVSLHAERITGVRIGKTAPHLFLTFSNGQTLVLNGSDTYYESWAIDIGLAPHRADATIVAVPGDELAVFSGIGEQIED
ncbi:hypothetical protein [Exiguobacterium acetylicum]|uniref:hypothetical protein n=1 Tax=Exiguobacterium acetylicum TaxID=41170 RepID=UPI001EE39C4E|nr:hypothetical protein [Exiguobacterium acetylicum]UKS54597.1 hypothetical protein K6T22_08495 [Exiguobacterium acetylicum]